MEFVPPVWEPRAAAPDLPAGVAHVWRLRAAEGDAGQTRWRNLLSAGERERLGRFHFEADARREAASRGALRMLLGGYLGISSDAVAFAAELRGKPVLAAHLRSGNASCDAANPALAPRLRSLNASRDAANLALAARLRSRPASEDATNAALVREDPAGSIEFNVSHSGDWVLLAFARGRRVGIDVEQWREIGAAKILGEFFQPEEAAEWALWPEPERAGAFFGAWTLKEAYLKALGAGFAKPLRSFRVRIAPGTAPALVACADDAQAPERWHLARLEMAPGYSAALATEREIERVFSYTLAPS
jgi:phosphopantetheinyl transferase